MYNTTKLQFGGDIMPANNDEEKKDSGRLANFGDRLIRLRKEKGFTIAYMAKCIGVTSPAYIFYEQGKHEPTLKNLERIANTLGVSVDKLLDCDSKEDVFERITLEWQNHDCTVVEGDDGKVYLKLTNGFRDENGSRSSGGEVEVMMDKEKLVEWTNYLNLHAEYAKSDFFRSSMVSKFYI